MNTVSVSEFPHALSADNTKRLLDNINGSAFVINSLASQQFQMLMNEPNFTNKVILEANYKQTVTELIKIHARQYELSALQPLLQNADPVSQTDRESSRWYSLIESGSVVPSPDIHWQYLFDGRLSWSVQKLSWLYQASPESSASSASYVRNTSVDVESFPLPPKLDSAKFRLVLKAFIEKGYVELLPDGHARWLFNRHASKCPVSFTCFVTNASDYLGLTTQSANVLPRYRRKELEELFQIFGTARKDSSAISASTRSNISKIFAGISTPS